MAGCFQLVGEQSKRKEGVLSIRLRPDRDSGSV